MIHPGRSSVTSLSLFLPFGTAELLVHLTWGWVSLPRAVGSSSASQLPLVPRGGAASSPLYVRIAHSASDGGRFCQAIFESRKAPLPPPPPPPLLLLLLPLVPLPIRDRARPAARLGS